MPNFPPCAKRAAFRALCAPMKASMTAFMRAMRVFPFRRRRVLPRQMPLKAPKTMLLPLSVTAHSATEWHMKLSITQAQPNRALSLFSMTTKCQFPKMSAQWRGISRRSEQSPNTTDSRRARKEPSTVFPLSANRSPIIFSNSKQPLKTSSIPAHSLRIWALSISALSTATT